MIAKKHGKTYIREGACNQCGFCCNLVTLFIDNRPVKTEEEFEHLKGVYPEYGRFYSRGRDESGCIAFTCRFLSEEFKCMDYENRPFICRDYPSAEILQKGGKLVSKCGYRFVQVEDFQAMLAKEMETAKKADFHESR